MNVDKFELFVLSPGTTLPPSSAIAACRAGAAGVLDLEFVKDLETARNALNMLASHVEKPYGIRCDLHRPELISELLSAKWKGLAFVILVGHTPSDLKQQIESLHRQKLRAIVETTCVAEAKAAENAGADAIIAKGSESGGRVGEETAYVLVQRLLQNCSLPVHVQGGIGIHSAAACFAAGAAGVVLDSQLALLRESHLPVELKEKLAQMDGTETELVGQKLGVPYRVFSRPGVPAPAEILATERTLVTTKNSSEDVLSKWREEIRQRAGWDLKKDLVLIGQDGAFAARLARKFVTVGGLIAGIREAIREHCKDAADLQPLGKGAPLAESHGTRYPIVQGPMARISDRGEFAKAVADGGGLPFVGLSLMRGDHLKGLLEETSTQLGNQPWGVGIIGFLPSEFRKPQIEMVRQYQPQFALIAGGRPDQAKELEDVGIATYLHVPTTGLLRMYLGSGTKRFIFEGRECGGHVGPLASFVLWETAIDTLLDEVHAGEHTQDYHILFAGGIHDARSAAMVSVMAAPLAKLGIRVGAQMGTVYLFAEEAVSTGAIVPQFQKVALEANSTVLLEVGPGHANRCAPTPFTEAFEDAKNKLDKEELTSDERRLALEKLNIGRLAIGCKGIAPKAADGIDDGPSEFVTLSDKEQVQQGMYMIGQVGALSSESTTIDRIHETVSVESSKLVDRIAKSLRRSKRSSKKNGHHRPSDIAIIGMSCFLPGAGDLKQYWENILNKVECVEEIPPERWDWRSYYDPDPNAKDKSYSKWGGFLSDTTFDPTDYGMPPKTVASTEPVQLLTLELVRRALDDAGYAEREFPRKRTSVILGAGGGIADLGLAYGFRTLLPHFMNRIPDLPINAHDVIDRLEHELPQWSEDTFPGLLLNVAAGRVANRFNLGGSNFAIDAACASSLAAVHVAVRELETHNCDLSVAGGIDVMQGPFAYLCFSKTRALSPTGRARPFDETADGIVIGEGLAALILKRKEDAMRDGDRIYAVIKGMGASSDGKDKGLTAPRPEGQMLALKRAYEKSGVNPSTIKLIEAHGTGTVAGDRAETESVSRILKEHGAEPHSCSMGSVKSMIGHSKCAAGVTGVVKAALSLHYKVMPATLIDTKPNEAIMAEDSPVFINTETQPWFDGGHHHPRRAGVSAFGFGGTNFHAVVEEHEDTCADEEGAPCFSELPSELFVWRAESREKLLAVIDRAIKEIDKADDTPLRVLAHRVAVSAEDRTAAKHPASLSIIASDRDDLRNKLESARSNIDKKQEKHLNDPRGIYFSDEPFAAEGKIAFLFSGQASQYVGMLRDLCLQYPEARETFERADEALKDRLPQPLSQYVFPRSVFDPEEEKANQKALTDTRIAQPAVGVASMALHRILGRFGVKADMVAGHSYGEYAALCAAGAVSEDDLIRISEARGRVIVEASGSEDGTMAAVGADEKTVNKIIDDIDGVIAANLNAPNQTVISGTLKAVEKAVALCKKNGLRAKRIAVSCAFHSPLVARAQEPLAKELSEATLSSPSIPVFSNTLAERLPSDPKDIADLLVKHLVSPVRFVEEIESMYDAGARLFVEIGPGSVLTKLAQTILGDRPKVVVASDQKRRSSLIQLEHLLGQLFVEGVPLTLRPMFEGRVKPSWNAQTRKPVFNGKKIGKLTYLVNGHRAIPIGQAKAETKGISARPPVSEKTVVANTSTATTSEKALKMSTQPVRAPQQKVPKSTTEPTSAPTPSAGRQPTAAPAPSPGRAQVMAEFQRTMAQFLETQGNVMKAYLTGASTPTDDLSSVSRQTPVEMPASPVAPEVKVAEETAPPQTVEKPTEIAPKEQDVEGTTPAESAETTEVAASELSEEELTNRLIDIVAERTGYPEDMLSLDLDLEADLGIDSIKRIEILGTLQQDYDLGDQSDMEQDIEELASLKTLRGIVDWLKNRADKSDEGSQSKSQAVPAAQAVSKESATEPAKSSQSKLNRFGLTVEDVPIQKSVSALPANGAMLIVDDGDGVGKAVADKLRNEGAQVVLLKAGETCRSVSDGIFEADFSTLESTADAIELIRKQVGAVGGMVYLLPLRGGMSFDKMDMAQWQERLKAETWTLFFLSKCLEEDLRAAAKVGKACLIATTGMGGSFGSVMEAGSMPCFPGQGAVAGFVKTLSWEWPEIRVRVVDFDTVESNESIVNNIVQEIVGEDAEVEVSWKGSRRTALRPVAAEFNGNKQEQEKIDSSSIFLVTGGARGITAHIACETARRYQPTLLLVGRSPLPGKEAENISGLKSAKDLKAALIAQAKAEGKKVKPAEVEAEYRKIIREREMRDNLAEMKSAGAKVHYFQADVRDPKQFGDVIDQAYNDYGKIDIVLHGAGVIEDKLIRDKTPESFDRVLGTKADSAFILSRKLRPESLRCLVFFSSVAGRFGNRGQADYAAANEVYNKLAVQLDRLWPGRVVAINWGPWATGGMVSAELEKQFAEHGIELVQPDAGVDKLEEEIRFGRNGEAEIILGGGGWEVALTGSASSRKDTTATNRLSDSRPAQPLFSAEDASFEQANGVAEGRVILDPSRDTYLNDHRIRGKAVLPMAMAAELMAETALAGYPGYQLVELRGLHVLKGVVVETGSMPIRSVAKTHLATPDGAEIELSLAGDASPDRLQYRATAELRKSIPGSGPVDPLVLLEPKSFPMDVPEAYNRWLFHGPSLQGIDEIIEVGSNGIIATLIPSTPDQCLPADAGLQWLVDPVVVDSALQLTLLWTRMYWDTTPLPSGYHSYKCFAPLAGERIVRCEVEIRPKVEHRLLEADITYRGADGRVLAVIEKVEGTCNRSLNVEPAEMSTEPNN